MNREEELKKLLTNIKGNNFEIPTNLDLYNLSLKMLENIGSVDAILRDNLILSVFFRIIEEERITHPQMKEILNLSLSEEHLFCGVGKLDDDSVFNRTFTACIIDAIISLNNNLENGFLSEDEVLKVYEKVKEYYKNEKDLRGYVVGKGWAHSTAHTADVLCSLSKSKVIKEKELIEILALIKEKICVDSYTYINEEEERLINVFMCIYDRKVLENELIIDWIYSFVSIKETGSYPNDEHLRENRKIFLRGLYFRLKHLSLDVDLLTPIDEVLSKVPAFY